MKKILWNIVCSFLLIACFNDSSNAQARFVKRANLETQVWRYEVECVSTGASGTYLVKVWSYSINPIVAIEQSKKNAIHGIIFKGFTGHGAGCTQNALDKNPTQDQEIFFNNFFADGGDYMKYVSTSTDGSIDAADILRIGKEFKIGVIVSVSKDALRKYLETAGILKSLDAGF